MHCFLSPWPASQLLRSNHWIESNPNPTEQKRCKKSILPSLLPSYKMLQRDFIKPKAVPRSCSGTKSQIIDWPIGITTLRPQPKLQQDEIAAVINDQLLRGYNFQSKLFDFSELLFLTHSLQKVFPNSTTHLASKLPPKLHLSTNVGRSAFGTKNLRMGAVSLIVCIERSCGTKVQNRNFS